MKLSFTSQSVTDNTQPGNRPMLPILVAPGVRFLYLHLLTTAKHIQYASTLWASWHKSWLLAHDNKEADISANSSTALSAGDTPPRYTTAVRMHK